MRFFARFVSAAALMLAFGCGGGDGGSEPTTASDCRTEGNGCTGDFSCQLNADDAYECLPSNQNGAAGEGGSAGAGGNEAGAAGQGGDSGNEAGNEAGTAGEGGVGGAAGAGGNEAGAAGAGGNEAGAAGSAGNEAGSAGEGGDAGATGGAAGEGGDAGATGGAAGEAGEGGEALSAEITFISIPSGTFDMGSNDGDPDEQPVHAVNVPTFEMSQSEVTVGQYRVCVDAGVCTVPQCGFPSMPGDTENHPIRCVRWYDAQIFAGFEGARLPSEAEWEYAARSGGQEITYPWGNEAPYCNRLNFDDCMGTTTPVCSYPTGNTVQGLCDMGGNVWEWVEDDWHGRYTDAPGDGSPWIDNPRGQYRVARGGSYFFNADLVRAAFRFNDDPSYGNADLGFRLARSAR